ncbi:hypothetical protein CEXT_209511 [Caerostris extrusa]|uniref:Uncharacterized protein n=1 Tax=Caerostris extrusa TaxID=172846 RepID=A0AAV4Y871_CAEEX|nr:hypothetical protein CEXT_209511 [Caerostris extrusa]
MHIDFPESISLISLKTSEASIFLKSKLTRRGRTFTQEANPRKSLYRGMFDTQNPVFVFLDYEGFRGSHGLRG